jgi:hypothetical protein
VHDKPYWFAARRYGWGWGLPLTWQGWLAYALWFAVLFGTMPFLHVRQHLLGHVVFLIGMAAVLLGICLWKGEPARWRWGD